MGSGLRHFRCKGHRIAAGGFNRHDRPATNVLFVVPYAPTLIRTRPYNLLLGLAKRGHSVTLATVWESAAEQDALRLLSSHGIRVWSRPLGRRQIAGNVLRALAAGAPLQAWYCWQPEPASILTRALEQNPDAFDVVHVEHLRGAE